MRCVSAPSRVVRGGAQGVGVGGCTLYSSALARLFVHVLIQPANFIILYVDNSEGPHCLTLSKYGEGRLCEAERWVLLERAAAEETNDEV